MNREDQLKARRMLMNMYKGLPVDEYGNMGGPFGLRPTFGGGPAADAIRGGDVAAAERNIPVASALGTENRTGLPITGDRFTAERQMPDPGTILPDQETAKSHMQQALPGATQSQQPATSGLMSGIKSLFNTEDMNPMGALSVFLTALGGNDQGTAAAVQMANRRKKEGMTPYQSETLKLRREAAERSITEKEEKEARRAKEYEFRRELLDQDAATAEWTDVRKEAYARDKDLFDNYLEQQHKTSSSNPRNAVLDKFRKGEKLTENEAYLMENVFTRSPNPIREIQRQIVEQGFDSLNKDQKRLYEDWQKTDPITRMMNELREQQNSQYPDAPPVGTERDGYVYKGGDPKDAKSWEKI